MVNYVKERINVPVKGVDTVSKVGGTLSQGGPVKFHGGPLVKCIGALKHVYRIHGYICVTACVCYYYYND